MWRNSNGCWWHACLSLSPCVLCLECVELWTSHFQEQSLPEPLSVNEIPERHCHEILNIYVSLAQTQDYLGLPQLASNCLSQSSFSYKTFSSLIHVLSQPEAGVPTQRDTQTDGQVISVDNCESQKVIVSFLKACTEELRTSWKFSLLSQFSLCCLYSTFFIPQGCNDQF